MPQQLDAIIMKTIKSLYLISAILVLMVTRPFASGEWFGSVVVAGLFIAWIDMTGRVWKENTNFISAESKQRYAITMICLTIVGIAQLIIAILNLILSFEWLNKSVVLDEITLFALLISLEQSAIVRLFNNIIK